MLKPPVLRCFFWKKKIKKNTVERTRGLGLTAGVEVGGVAHVRFFACTELRGAHVLTQEVAHDMLACTGRKHTCTHAGVATIITCIVASLKEYLRRKGPHSYNSQYNNGYIR